MFQAKIIVRFRSAPTFSTCPVRFDSSVYDRKEAPLIDNEAVLSLPEEARQNAALEATITVPAKVNEVFILRTILVSRHTSLW